LTTDDAAYPAARAMSLAQHRFARLLVERFDMREMTFVAPVSPPADDATADDIEWLAERFARS
jgi:hypothetical protein